MIKRFNPDFSLSISHELAYMRETPEGGYVAHGDYATLFSELELELVKAERDALAQRVEMLAQNLGNAIWGEQEALQRVNALAGENAKMREAIDFATAEDMWIEQHDGMLDYRYCEWYVDVLNAAKETPVTTAALAAIRTESHIAGLEAAANRIGVISLNYKPGQKQELIKAIGREILHYANELREEK